MQQIFFSLLRFLRRPSALFQKETYFQVGDGFIGILLVPFFKKEEDDPVCF